MELAWTGVTRAWESDAVHERFLSLCASLDRLDDAGRRYRGVREGADPGRRAEAERRIEALLGLAMQRLRVERTEKRPRGPFLLVAIILSLSITICALFALLHMR